ncbi:MAG TPA: CAP domain-containing protein [Gaiellaceae bacterium]|nr:CAP domain-containing protein [Gaiellaceae bacterium]
MRSLRSFVLTFAAAALLSAFAVAPVASPAHAKGNSSLAALQTGVLTQLNLIRRLHDLTPLKLSSDLNASATQHTREMGDDGYFQHPSFDGTLFWKRIQTYYSSSGYGYWSVGENLLWSSPNVDALDAARLWMNSPEHRANILDPRWREIGISAMHFAAAPGTYGDRPVTIITTDFGIRR